VANKPEKPLRVSVWAGYEEDLAQIAAQLPPNARRYALASWHCDLTDHRCIHDSRVEVISVVEQKRAVGIVIRLTGAHQDRHLLLKFLSVRRYSMEHPAAEPGRHKDAGHGDVLDDSFKLTPDGYVVYSLRMEFGNIEIEAKDIQFSQQPI
jgi:hypothetical protein